MSRFTASSEWALAIQHRSAWGLEFSSWARANYARALSRCPHYIALRQGAARKLISRTHIDSERGFSAAAGHEMCSRWGMDQASAAANPEWWTDEHTSSWERVKHALHRDWEQTKGDLADNGVDLNQGATDTIRQALGAQDIPPDGFPNPGPRHGSPSDWATLEPALRFGHGAYQHYSGREWDDTLTTQLRSDWESTQQESTWESAKAGVERGWHSVRRAL